METFKFKNLNFSNMDGHPGDSSVSISFNKNIKYFHVLLIYNYFWFINWFQSINDFKINIRWYFRCNTLLHDFLHWILQNDL